MTQSVPTLFDGASNITSTQKFGRNYYLQVTTPEGLTVTIEPPFTLELDITRNSLAGANCCQLRLYNLAYQTRQLIHFNSFNLALFNSIVLYGGYGSNLSVIFTGNVTRAWSVREGVNFITQIESYDGGFALVNGVVNITFPAGTPIQSVILYMMAQLPEVSFGAVSAFAGVLPRANTYHGNPKDILNELTGNAFYIDSGKAFCLKTGDYNATQPIIYITDATGLLNTPTLEETKGHFEMLFEPTLGIGSLVFITSETNELLNGSWIITGIKHRGIISPVVSGDLITTGEFIYAAIPTPVAVG